MRGVASAALLAGLATGTGVLLTPQPAMAQQATGGAAEPSTVDVDAGGNGGDAGMPGSNGSGTSAGAGGTAGTAGVPHGGNGTDGTPFSGSGGGGGGGGYSGTASGDIASPMTGGTGGNGADGDPAIGFGGGGGGGAGGDGVRISGAAGPISVSAEVAGGHGGHGGGGIDSGGGGGGAGVVMLDAGDITVGARVSGGRGGAHIGGISGGGGGGAGIILEQGGGLTIENGAAITGGDGGHHGNGGTGVLLEAAGTVTVASGTVAGGAGIGLGSGGAAIAATASGATIVNAGALQGGVSDGSSSGGLPGAAGGTGSGGAPGFVPNTLLVGRGGAGILGATGGGTTIINSGSIAGGTGSGGLANAISLSGSNNSLELWSGSTITGNVVVSGGGANNVLALGGETDATFDASQIGATQQYQGFDTFEKTGTSIWTLTGTATEAAPWTVNAGTLLVNGSIASSVLTTVNAGGVLGGIGTVGDTLIDGGVLAPGNSIGALTVAGNLVLTAASTYMVEVDPTSADFTHVTGTATLGGATVAAHFAPGSYVEKRYTILTADGGVSGTFSGPANTNLPTNFQSALAYDGTNAFLDLTLAYQPATGPLNGNQQQVAATLTDFFDRTGGIPLSFGALDSRGLSQASGEMATGASQAAFDAQGQFLNAMTDPFAAGQGTAGSSSSSALSYAAISREGRAHDAYAALFTKAAPPAVPFAQRWRVFGAAYGGSAQISGNAALGSHDATARVYGGIGGAAYTLSPDTRLGFALGGGGTAFGLSDGLGSGRSDLFQAGVFARHGFAQGGYLAGAFAYGWHDVSTERSAPTGERLRGAYKAHVLSGRVEAGWRVETALAGVTPYAAAQAISYRLPSYREQGSGAADSFALGFTGRDVAATRSELGLRFDRSMAMNDALVTLRARAAWAHNFDTERALAATFQALPGTGFLVNGAVQAADAALISAGAEIGWRNGLSLAATFEGEFSNTTESYAGKGRVRYAW